MFVAINPNGENNLLFTRIKNVFFIGGTKKIQHFYHERHVECSFVGEPETQEHLGGKLAIYHWLKKKYPNAYVALEERIAKTNQIADVYADFGNGHKFAFEINVRNKRLERRKLYEKRGNKIHLAFWG